MPTQAAQDALPIPVTANWFGLTRFGKKPPLKIDQLCKLPKGP
jgi:hypothetical protein